MEIKRIKAMKDKEKQIEEIRNLALDIRENNDKELWLEKFIYAICEQVIQPLEEQLKDLDWYKMWHKKFRKEIEDLTTEVETYRPTKLSGNGQCKCDVCGSVCWTDWFSRYKGQTLCDKCLKKIMESNPLDKLKEINQKLEEALLDMVVQFCQMGEEGYLKHAFMSAEEQAFDTLEIQYGEKVSDVYKRFFKRWGREYEG